MASEKISELILQETKNLPDEMLKEVLDFVLFLKDKAKLSPTNTSEQALSKMQQDELTHLEEEFENYKIIYPNE